MYVTWVSYEENINIVNNILTGGKEHESHETSLVKYQTKSNTENMK